MTWLVDTLLATGVLIALVLVVRRPVARLFGPGLAYALWALPLVRLVLPPLVLPTPPQAVETVVLAGAPAPAVIVPTAAVFDWTVLALWIWLGGAALYLGWRAGQYTAMRRTLLRDATRIGRIGKVRLVETPQVASPIAFGIVDKVVALPPGFDAVEDRELALAHELEHHAGHDLVANLAVQPLLALHWFNPLAWIAWRALRRDQEAACDARVLAGRSAQTRAAYGRLLARFAAGRTHSFAAPLGCAAIGEKSIIHRLRSLTMTPPSTRRRLAGRALIAAAVLALPLSATVTYAARNDDSAPPTPPAASPPEAAPKVERRIVIIKQPGSHPTVADGTPQIRTIEIVERHGAPEGTAQPSYVQRVVRNGRTYIFKTSKPMTKDEVEARITELEEGRPLEADAVEIGSEAAKHEPGHPDIEFDGAGTWLGKGDDADLAVVTCRNGTASEARADQDYQGKKQVVRVKVCTSGGQTAHALTALKDARERLSKDENLSAEIRAKVVKQLDEKIAELAKQG